LFLDRLEMALRRTKLRPSGDFAVLVVHLDQFAKWRETLAVSSRERALFDVGRRIDSVLGPVDSLCLWNRNEFAILHEGAMSDGNAEALAGKIRQELRAPVVDGSSEMFLTTSIGVVTGLTGDESAEDVVHFASTAAARARNAGIGRVEVADMVEGLKKRRSPSTKR
jgi:diguanylate cyclase (GGDEF)-like protein